MTSLRTAAQQALKALDCPGKAKTADEQAAITALRAALATPVLTAKEREQARYFDGLDVGVRAANALRAEGITTIAQLEQLTHSDLLKIPGVGRISMWTVIYRLEEAGKALKEPPSFAERMQAKQDDLPAMLAIWGERCEEFDVGCSACQAWQLFDTYKTPPDDEAVFALTQQGSLASPES